MQETCQVGVVEFPAWVATLLVAEVATGSNHDQLGNLLPQSISRAVAHRFPGGFHRVLGVDLRVG